MFDYSSLGAGAAEMIRDAGVAITLIRADDYDTGSGEVLDSGTQRFSGHAVRDSYRLSEIDGTRIRSGDVKLYTVIGTQPERGDMLSIENETWRVEDCEAVKPGPATLLYIVQARKP
jgi:hypothetical protein